jgi:glycosyltransferase involved in cell wall biosynthesis
MCGTPVITSDFGAFPETIQHGKTGYRCHTLGDYMKAVELAPQLDRKYIRENAVNLYSYETVGQIYDNIFKQISNLKNGGWYNLESIFVK